ncbi:hypothetical protein WQ54_23480 [Bacillus sp. SA1-12]|uniref:DUF3231 family protein n=1 Tax=Bacillus sp. SA1-12 TaxID=1455638 RepID=UPI000627228B|nr:DUF3231 family protein [Bacillus sp. SA1-12]KKI90080.1 hypothetical protein WQ54_23480 [Bacillus sp. SA1-12]
MSGHTKGNENGQVLTEHKIPLTAAEVGFLWTQYMNDSLATCVFKYFKRTCEDIEILKLIEDGIRLTQKNLTTITAIFNEENHPIPVGFTDEDVNENAPRLFTDTFMLMYFQKMGNIAMAGIGVAIGVSAREDVSHFFNELLVSSANLHDKARKLMLAKGIYIRPPQISTPDKVTFVKKQSFLFDFIGQQKRPLSAIEITHLYINVQTNALGKAMMMAFAQVCKNEDVKQYFMAGKNISNKHINKFSSILTNGDVPAPMNWDSNVLDSMVAPFSDKLMMLHTTGMIAIGIGNYGTAAGTCHRLDLSATYTRLSAEIALYAEDGANILIKHGWLEEPPQSDDRQALIKQSK